jgi:hypothetical protein
MITQQRHANEIEMKEWRGKKITEKIYGLHMMGNILRERVHKKSTEEYRDDKRKIK